MSIVWMVFMFVMLVVAKRHAHMSIKSSSGMRKLSNHQAGMKRQSSLLQKIQKTIEEDQDQSTIIGMLKRNLSFILSRSQTLEEGVIEGIKLEPYTNGFEKIDDLDIKEVVGDEFRFAYDYMNGTGELYMRCGVAMFSIATMIDRCLSLVQIYEVYANNNDAIKECWLSFACSSISNILSLIFIFLQSFFIFKYANIIINYGKNASVIGLMHIISTNFCVCLRTIIHETVSEIRHYSVKSHESKLI